MRQEGRKIAESSGFKLPRTVTYKTGTVPDYSDLCADLEAGTMVLTPPYSDGGAWVYVARNELDCISAISDIENSFPDEYVEITPYYEGIPLNLTVCNVPRGGGVRVIAL